MAFRNKNGLLLILATVLGSLTPVFAKVTVAEISPLSLGFFRFGTAAVLFYITLKIKKGNLRFEKKDYYILMMLSILCIPFNQFFFLVGIKNSFASHSGVIYALNPVFAYMTAIIRKTEKFYASKLIAILLTITGIFFVFYESLTSAGGGPLFGDAFLVLAVLTFSFYISLGKEFIDKYGALKVTTFIFISGSFFNLPFFIYDIGNLNFDGLTATGITGALYLTFVISYITYFLWLYVLKSITISKLTTFSNISPLITVLVSIIFLSEVISVYFIVGGIITLAGVFIMQRVSLELS